MPVYAYHCTTCEKEFEVSQRMTDPPLTDCECGSKGTVQRLLSAGAGVIFKGSGFYQTDYKGGSSSSSSAKDSAPKSDGGGHTCGSANCCMKSGD